MPEKKSKPSKNDESKPLTWGQVVAKLQLRGLSPQQIGRMTKMQAFLAVEEMNEELKVKTQLAGFEVPEDNDKEATLQDLMAFGM